MTHVWQHQKGINVVLARILRGGYEYLPLVPGRAFEDYGIEQQGDIVRDYFFLRFGRPVEGAPDLEAYERLIPFVPFDGEEE